MRKLIFHPESDCLFEVHTDLEYEQAMDGDCMCSDVTGVTQFEERFKREREDARIKNARSTSS